MKSMAATARLTIDDFERPRHDAVINRELAEGELVAESGNTLRQNIVRGRLSAEPYA